MGVRSIASGAKGASFGSRGAVSGVKGKDFGMDQGHFWVQGKDYGGLGKMYSFMGETLDSHLQGHHGLEGRDFGEEGAPHGHKGTKDGWKEGEWGMYALPEKGQEGAAMSA